MKTFVRASLFAAVTFVAIDAEAAADRHCVTQLEAVPPKPALSEKKPCPVAVAWTRRAPRVAGTATSGAIRA